MLYQIKRFVNVHLLSADGQPVLFYQAVTFRLSLHWLAANIWLSSCLRLKRLIRKGDQISLVTDVS